MSSEMIEYYRILLNIIVLLQDHFIYREGSFVLEKSNSGRCHSHNEEDEEDGDKESEEAEEDEEAEKVEEKEEGEDEKEKEA